MLNQKAFVKALKFAAHAAGNDDIRGYLNGVLFEIRPGVLTLVATDGKRMAVVSMSADWGLGMAELDVIVPNVSVKKLLSALGPVDEPRLILVPCEQMLVLSDCEGRDHLIEGIEGTFPEWRRVSTVHGPLIEGTAGMFSKQVAAAATACAALEGGSHPSVTLEFRGEDRALVFRVLEAGYEEAFCLVMPLRRK